MILGLSGHLGDRVSALVDGQLTPAEEERAWNHVTTCPGCRRLVEKEGWLKTRLSSLNAPAPVAHPAEQVRPQLLGALYDVDAWAAVDRLDEQARPRRIAVIAAVGASSVGAAVFGLVALTAAPASAPRPAPATVSGVPMGPRFVIDRTVEGGAGSGVRSDAESTTSAFADVARHPGWLPAQLPGQPN